MDHPAAKAELAEHNNDPDQDSSVGYDPHVYDGERCINCTVNVYDDMIYGPFECVPREPMSYTTETPHA